MERQSNGKYSISTKEYDFWKSGVEHYKTELYAAPEASPCNIPTNLNGGKKGSNF